VCVCVQNRNNFVLEYATGRGENVTIFWLENLMTGDHLGRPRRRRDDNIRMDLRETGW
jgi:hypothetical protein